MREFNLKSFNNNKKNKISYLDAHFEDVKAMLLIVQGFSEVDLSICGRNLKRGSVFIIGPLSTVQRVKLHFRSCMQ